VSAIAPLAAAPPAYATPPSNARIALRTSGGIGLLHAAA